MADKSKQKEEKQLVPIYKIERHCQPGEARQLLNSGEAVVFKKDRLENFSLLETTIPEKHE